MNNIKSDLLAQFAEECTEFPDRNALNMYQTLATENTVYPSQGTPLGLAYIALKGLGEASEFAAHVGKAMCDDGFGEQVWDNNDNIPYLKQKSVTKPRKELLIKEIGDQLWHLAITCNELGITLADAALINVQKLKDRQERGVLRGSGDQR